LLGRRRCRRELLFLSRLLRLGLRLLRCRRLSGSPPLMLFALFGELRFLPSHLLFVGFPSLSLLTFVLHVA
jgi:hypothetical protein